MQGAGMGHGAVVASKLPVARLLALYLVSCILFLSLSGCGFRLRGAVALPPQMAQTRIEGTSPNGPLGSALADAIERGGGTVVKAGSDAAPDSVLQITNERFDRRVLSVGADRKVSEYEVNYAVGFELKGSDGEVLVHRQTVDVTRDYVFDTGSVLGKSDEEEVLRSEMLTFVVQQIMRRLYAQALNRTASGDDASAE